MIRHPPPSRRTISLRPSYLSVHLLKCALMTALVLLCLDSRVHGNGIDVDGFLRDFEKQRGEIKTYSARFLQEKTLELFGETKVSTGTVLYKAPQKMIWKYETPDRTQMRIERGSVSFYFPELEQIEIYPMEQGGGASNFFFAFEATADELKKSFKISMGAADEDFYRIDLLPKSESAASQPAGITLWLGRSDYLPRKILIREISGDSTRIDLSDMEINEPIADDEMEFDAPEGTTIVEDESGAF